MFTNHAFKEGKPFTNHILNLDSKHETNVTD